MKIMIGTPVYRDGAYALEKFLANQQQIQQNYADCDLVFSTDDSAYARELENLLQSRQLRGSVILHNVEKPGYARSRLWNIAGGRESLRQYFLSRPEAEKLLFLDADMTYDPAVIAILEKEIAGHDAVFSGYRFRNDYLGLTGAGCLLLTRRAMEKTIFRCYEFKNGQTINEDNVLEMDLFRHGCRIRKGYFLSIDHYAASGEVKHADPHKVSLYRRIMTSATVRFMLIRISIALHYNVPNKGRLYASRY